MPRCICEKVQLPPFESRPIASEDVRAACESYTIHSECRYCKGFNIFTWDEFGRKVPPTTHKEFLETAKAYNNKLRAQLEVRLKSRLAEREKYQQQRALHYESSDMLDRLDKRIRELRMNIKTCVGKIQ
ncbi:hypothetical protein VSWAT3_00818 [Vibrionales bacterium SWAT-3]|nr:hypothetical protein VSWAT3_00818 [Vibrionales bacterium SWAT-3]